jgi:hypothetical protein
MRRAAAAWVLGCLVAGAAQGDDARRLILPTPGELPVELLPGAGGNDEVTELPPLVVSPSELDRWHMDRNLQRYRETLPSLGTEVARKKDLSERIREALGLTGEGVQGLHHADQQDLANFVEKLDGQLE